MNWYLQNGKESDVVVSSKIRILRNIQGYGFTNKCTEKQKLEILSKMEEILPGLGYDLQVLKLKDIDEITKMSLIEKDLISVEFAMNVNEEKAIAINKDENICIVINDEDHICIQVFSEGLALDSLLNMAIEIDKKIEKLVPYSYSKKYGYLTACPINVGTGMKASTFIHLPGLKITENINKILRIINGFGMNVEGLYGEGKSDLYQISNNKTLGITEEEIVNNVKAITDKVIIQEREARKYLGNNGLEFENKVYRNFGLLKYSKILPLDECLNILSIVKLGTDMGIIKELDDLKIKKMYLYCKNANLQKYYGQTMNKKEQDIKRSQIIAEIINS